MTHFDFHQNMITRVNVLTMMKTESWYATQTRRCSWIRIFSVTVLVTFSIAISIACGQKPGGTAPVETNSNSSHSSTAAVDAGPIIQRYRALDDSRDSTIKLVASISGNGEHAEIVQPKQVNFTMYRKRQPDGRLSMLVEFTAPSEERDRDGLITVFPDGQIEGIRYVQSTDSFIVTRDVLSEDALFGLTLQELADGQPEKYDFTVTGEGGDGDGIYELEGKLKSGVESKFMRLALVVSKQNYAAKKADFYDKQGQLARTLIVNKTEQIGGHWTRTKWTIDNRARQKKIDFSLVDAVYDHGLNDSLFTREHLKKIASR